MWYMSFNAETKAPNGWAYTQTDTSMIEVSDDVRTIHEAHPDYIWDGTTLVAPPLDPAMIIEMLTTALETYYDSIAKVKRYDSRLTCALRAGYAGPFQNEGATFAIWMDNCNAYSYQVMSDVKNGLRSIPTAEDLLLELPVAPW